MASHGGSPSGRFIAVGGRGSRPERDFGRGRVVVRGEFAEVERGFCWVSGVLGVDDFLRAVGLLLLAVRVLAGDPSDPGREAGVGVLYDASASSRRIWLPTLLPRLRALLYAMPTSSPVQLPLAPLFRGSGVPRSMCSCGIGIGLDLGSGIREELFRRSGCR